MTPEFPVAIPEIPVTDLQMAVALYRDRLGFGVDWVADDIALAGVSRDHCRLFLAGPDFRKGRGDLTPVVIWLNLDSRAAVDTLHQLWSGRGVMLRSTPEAKPWKLYEFTAADGDGNDFRVFYDFGWEERERASRD